MWWKYIKYRHKLDYQMLNRRSVKKQFQSRRHKRDWNFSSLSYDSTGTWLKAAERIDKLSHLHKFQPAHLLAISEAWLDDRAPDGSMVSGNSRAIWMEERELSVKWEHRSSGSPMSHRGLVVQISSFNRDTVTKISPSCKEYWFATEMSSYSFIQAAGKYI